MSNLLSGAEIFVRCLESLGIHYVFGMPGGPALPLLDRIGTSGKLRFILTKTETAAAYMADAIAKHSGKPVACLTTAGPGSTNLCTGIATSFSDSTPVIAVSGQIITRNLHRQCHDEVDMCRLFEPITKKTFFINDVNRVQEIVCRAVNTAISPRCGPVHISFPEDIQTQTAFYVESVHQPAARPRSFLAPEAHDTLGALLKEHRNFAILCGGGCRTSGRDVRSLVLRLAEALQAPVFSTYNGKGVIPEDSHIYVGRVGELAPPYVFDVIQDAEVLISLGCRFTDVSTNNWRYLNPHTKIVQVDTDPTECGKIILPFASFTSDICDFLRDFLGIVGSHQADAAFLQRASKMKGAWLKDSYAAQTKQDPLHPKTIMETLDRLLSERALIIADAGANKRWAANFLTIRGQRTWIHSGGFAPMGYGVAGAVGLAIVFPEEQVIAVAGDASFHMTAGEIATARDNGASPTIIVLNDQGMGIIRELQTLRYGGRTVGSRYEKGLSCARIAEAYGAEAVTVSEISQLESAIDASRPGKVPLVVEMMLEHDSFITDMYAVEGENEV